uniref:CSON000095 protein n=1 Tax=Culicoides sonorensis TaxID=179676 RepID=A0A336LQ04_CULSO
MEFSIKNSLLLFISASLIFFTSGIQAQSHNFEEHRIEKAIWCTVSQEEFYKCGNLTRQLERDRQLFDDDYLAINCTLVFDMDDCIAAIDQERAHLMTLDGGQVFAAGRYNSLVPIMQETYEGDVKAYHAVAVVKKGTLPEVRSIRDLRGKKACFSYVGSLAGWTVPIHELQKRGGMQIVDCNNHVKSAIEFFGPSCAVNSLVNKNNPIGDNSDKLCQLCIGKIPGGRCSGTDPYAGFEGAFRCLVEAGDVAFLRHNTVDEMVKSKSFRSLTADTFELLCTDGTRAPLSEYRSCSWGKVPSHAVVTSSARTSEERRQYQRFLTKLVEFYSVKRTNSSLNGNTDTNSYNNNNYDRNYNRYDQTTQRYITGRNWEDRQRFESQNPYDQDENYMNQTKYEQFELFDSYRYGKKVDLMFSDNTHSLALIKEDDQLHTTYLGDSLNIIMEVRQCPVGRMTLCVTSDAEYDKCIKMRTALKAQLVKPEMICYKAHSHINCMQAIQSGTADVTVLDASDVYTAGLRYNLIPFISEIYNLPTPEYYVVAVAKEEDPDTELTYLKGKYTCHSGVNTAAGWVYPMAYLVSNGWMRPYGCDSMRAAAEYFTKSCLPGALSSEYNTGVPYDNLCDLCHGASFRYCRRDASEDYYGNTGAFRCLVEGGGHVAFVKHTTVLENTGGKRTEWWARDALPDDYELLCPDGTRAEVQEYERCNLGKVKANAIVTRGGDAYNETQINAFINLFVYAQQYYGRKEHDDFGFSMFYSPDPYHDLIFQDATRQLQVIDKRERYFSDYVGPDFMRAKRITDCHAGAFSISSFSHISNTLLLTSLTIFTSYLIQRFI